jgi:hypothetical protein
VLQLRYLAPFPIELAGYHFLELILIMLSLVINIIILLKLILPYNLKTLKLPNLPAPSILLPLPTPLSPSSLSSHHHLFPPPRHLLPPSLQPRPLQPLLPAHPLQKLRRQPYSPALPTTIMRTLNILQPLDAVVGFVQFDHVLAADELVFEGGDEEYGAFEGFY